MLPRQEYRQKDRSQARDGSKAIPVAQRPRPVLYHLQKPLKEWLKQGVNETIFKNVPDGETITWYSPLVLQPKPTY